MREAEAYRRTSAERFAHVECPIVMIMSETMAGTSGDRARQLTTTWRESVDQLAASRPSITVRRVPGGHDLVVTHPEQVLAHILATGTHHRAEPRHTPAPPRPAPPRPQGDAERPTGLVDTS
ncbi:hypothetical protein [Streptomyces sp. NPDC006335]|uniref:hypothetical protein n=1 Tax=Streptomyces sp. NPDC006335 TaxID=3156895 RepID=UPI00339E12E3